VLLGVIYSINGLESAYKLQVLGYLQSIVKVEDTESVEYTMIINSSYSVLLMSICPLVVAQLLVLLITFLFLAGYT
jgi:hypothetical protein